VRRSGSEQFHRFKGEWSLEKAKDLYCLLNKKRMEREKKKKRRNKKEERRGAKI